MSTQVEQLTQERTSEATKPGPRDRPSIPIDWFPSFARDDPASNVPVVTNCMARVHWRHIGNDLEGEPAAAGFALSRRGAVNVYLDAGPAVAPAAREVR